MVYINSNSGTITIPKHTNVVSDSGYTLVLTSNLSNSVVLVENGGNISTNGLYYKFALNSLDDLNVGEYTYTLYDDSEHVVETGLLTYGTFERQIIVNNTFNREKIQYNPDAITGTIMVKDNTLYYGFGQSVEDMLQTASKSLIPSGDYRYLLENKSIKDDVHFYVVYKEQNFKGKKPVEFTCGGCPMVMNKSTMTIDNRPCTVWVSGAIYPPETELSVISDNF